jgi:DNA uptake protein ComE-like DNA-binding protein
MNRKTQILKGNGLRWSLTLALAGTMCGLVACSSQPQTPAQQDQQLKEQAAKTTQDVKQGAKQAAAEAKVGAAQAERKLDAIAAGVKEGLHSGSPSDKPGAGRIDLNSASEDDLASLPGISRAKAGAIIDARPYTSSHQLVTRHLLTESQYERISTHVTAR